MRRPIRWITETAAMLAMLIALQWVGSMIPAPTFKQLITGSCVNAVLAITVLTVGYSSGITVALVSPVFAFLLNIAPNIVTVVPIMIGNVCFVLLLRLLYSRALWRQITALATAAVSKFAVLYVLVVKVICDLAAPDLLGKKVGDSVVLAPKMLKMLPAMFSWTQLVTALIGGTVALLIRPVLRKALRE